jgi:hypothetical protein
MIVQILLPLWKLLHLIRFYVRDMCYISKITRLILRSPRIAPSLQVIRVVPACFDAVSVQLSAMYSLQRAGVVIKKYF